MPVTKNVLFRGYPTGVATLTLDLTSYDGSSDVQTAIGMTETATGSGNYVAAVTAVVTTQTYGARIKRGGSLIGGMVVDLSELAGTYPLQDSPSAGEIVAKLPGVGTGANTVTITVQTTGAVAIQAATVTIWSGASMISTGVTNSSGVVTLAANAGSYTVNIVASGYNSSSSNALTVSGATTHTYQLSALAITPATPPEVTGYTTCVDRLGNPLVGELFIFTPIGFVQGTTGTALDNTTWSVQSGSGGLVQSTFLTNARYYVQQGTDGIKREFTAPDATFELPSTIG